MAIGERDTANPPRLRLDHGDDGRAISAAEFAASEAIAPWVFERVRGRVQGMSPDGAGHVRHTEPWRDRLGAHALAHPEKVAMVVSQAWIRIDAETDRIADIAVNLAGNGGEVRIPDQVPELVFEVVSRSERDRRRDYVEKRADYARAGVREYVIIDRFDRRVTVLTLAGDGFQERALGSGDLYETSLLPGLSVRLAEVLGR